MIITPKMLEAPYSAIKVTLCNYTGVIITPKTGRGSLLYYQGFLFAGSSSR